MRYEYRELQLPENLPMRYKFSFLTQFSISFNYCKIIQNYRIKILGENLSVLDQVVTTKIMCGMLIYYNNKYLLWFKSYFKYMENVSFAKSAQGIKIQF